jgi:pilus assembly protein CpaB
MGAARIIVIVVAFVAAIGVVVLMRGVIFDKKDTAKEAATSQPMAQVVVAERDLTIGTQLKAGDVSWQPWPAASVNPLYITNGAKPAPAPDTPIKKAANVVQTAAAGSGPMEALYGAIVKEPILKGEPVLARKIVRGGEGGYMSVVLQPGMRAISMAVSIETSVAGWILPGDRVDVLQSQQEGDSGRITRVVLQNIRVLAIDQKVEPDKDSKTAVGGVATLEASPAAAAVLIDAKAQGKPLYLALRSYADLGGPSGIGPEAMRSKPLAIKVFRNGQVSEVGTSQ